MSTNNENPYDPPGFDATSTDGFSHPNSGFSLQVRLCVMMFLQYFVQGCYLPVVSVYLQDALGFDAQSVGWFGSALAVGPLAAPFVLGQMVDRLWPTQRVLAICHLSGGVTMLLLYMQTDFWPVIVLGTVYSVLYIPTLMLTNSLTFHHLTNRDRQFPIIRLFGTIGFVVPAWVVESWWLRGLEGEELNTARGIVFLLAGIAGLVMGIYSFTLPGTPPKQQKKREFAPGAVIGMMRLRYFCVLVLVTFFVAVVHKFYFVWNSPYLKDVLRSGAIQGAWEQRISSIGQISEVAVMAVLGMMVSRFGFKITMAIGIGAYFFRCVCLAGAISLDIPFAGAMTIACVGQALHGLCFGCFLAAAFMFVDQVAPVDIRGSMQNLYGTFVLGLGFFAGGFAAAAVGKTFTTLAGSQTVRDQLGIATTAGLVDFVNKKGVAQVRDWAGIWLTCAALAAFCLVAFLILFPRKIADAEDDS